MFPDFKYNPNVLFGRNLAINIPLMYSEQFQQGFFFWRVGLPTMGPRQSPGEGPGRKGPKSLKDLVLWNHLLLIKIYPPQTVMKLIQHLFSKILPNFEFEENFSIQSYASLTCEDLAHLQKILPICILLKIYRTKKFLVRVWAPKLV